METGRTKGFQLAVQLRVVRDLLPPAHQSSINQSSVIHLSPSSNTEYRIQRTKITQFCRLLHSEHTTHNTHTIENSKIACMLPKTKSICKRMGQIHEWMKIGKMVALLGCGV